jgi:hypothetical protein
MSKELTIMIQWYWHDGNAKMPSAVAAKHDAPPKSTISRRRSNPARQLMTLQLMSYMQLMIF